jgi:soluble cytochrome b562
MKKVLLLALILALILALGITCFAEELDEAGLIERGKQLIVEWGDILIGVIDVISEYTPDDWKVVIDEKVVPWVTLAVSAVLSIYLAISPVLYKIKKTSDTFDKASDKLDKSQELTEKAKKQLKSTQDDIMKLEGEFAEVKEGYKQMITSVSNIEKIVRLAFENNDELIVKGFANEIAKVGSEDEVIKENEKA